MTIPPALKSTALYVAPFAAAGVETFVEYLMNSSQPLTRDSIVHAFMAAVLLETGLLKIQLQNWLKSQGSLATAVATNSAALAAVVPQVAANANAIASIPPPPAHPPFPTSMPNVKVSQ
jgi:hypothetical protein